MRSRACCGILSLAALLAAAACGSTPAAPTPPAVAPQLVTPANGAQVANQTQPVKLVVNNAPAATTAGTRTYTFELASDVAFTNKVQTKDGVAEGSGQTSVTLDPLTSVKDYYWRARAQTGTTPGTFSDPFKFTIGAAITLAAPAPIGPLTNAETTPRPALRVSNASRSGPAAPWSPCHGHAGSRGGCRRRPHRALWPPRPAARRRT